MARARALLVVVALGVLLAACGRDAGGAAAVGEPSGELLVFAAASLTDAFTELADSFTERHPTVEVAFNFAGSQVLANQIVEGAPADVFASADVEQMGVVGDAGDAAAAPVVFAGNALEIAVEPGNPLGVERLADLADPALIVVLAAAEVPAGRYARAALDAAGVTVTPASLEPDVRAALSKVELGEADAAVVYASDVAAARGRVAGVAIPAEHNVPATYTITTLAHAPAPLGAQAFVEHVLSPEGQEILAAHGLTGP